MPKYNLTRVYADGRPNQPGRFCFNTLAHAVRTCRCKNRALDDLGHKTFSWQVIELDSQLERTLEASEELPWMWLTPDEGGAS